MTRKTYPLSLTARSSAREEVDWLAGLFHSIPEGTFVDSLFSPALLDWFEGKASDDFSTDVMADRAYLIDQNRQLSAEVEAVNRERDKAIRAFVEYRDQVGIETNQIRADAARDADRLRALLSEAYNEMAVANRNLMDQGIDLHEAREALGTAEAEVIRLKARLYDLTVEPVK